VVGGKLDVEGLSCDILLVNSKDRSSAAIAVRWSSTASLCMRCWRDGPGFALAHCWAHTKRRYEEIADQWPMACAEIRTLIGKLYAIERLVPGPLGDAAVQTLRQQLRSERSRPILDRIWQWATA
jgi:transposase IS66 family protein